MSRRRCSWRSQSGSSESQCPGRSSRPFSCCSCLRWATASARSSFGAWQGRPKADPVFVARAGALPAGAVSFARRSLDSISAMRPAYTPARRPFRRRSASRPDQINRLGLPPDQAKAYLDAIPIGYAVTYIFGTIGSAIILAQLGPKLIGVDLANGLRRIRETDGRRRGGHDPGVFSAYRQIAVRAYRITAASGLAGKPVRELFPGLTHLRRARPPRRRDHRSRRRQHAGGRRRRRDLRARARCSSSTSRRSCRKSTIADCSICRSTMVDVFVRSKQLSG